MRNKLFRVEFAVSRPCEKSAHGWGTRHFAPMKIGTAGPSTAFGAKCAPSSAQDDRIIGSAKKGKCGR
jgi:hypothetical protein